jgi:SAM-dependent methyltransferase
MDMRDRSSRTRYVGGTGFTSAEGTIAVTADDGERLNYERIYAYRFAGIDQTARQGVWDVIARDVYRRLGEPRRVLDPAAGRGEFLRSLDAAEERVGVDLVASEAWAQTPGVRYRQGDIFATGLPPSHFDGVFVSNFLEHLASPEEVHRLLALLGATLRPGGRIAVMGPNFKYCFKDYFDCADHKLALSHLAVEELLYSAGFRVRSSHAKYLPYSFRSKLPASPALVRLYLALPWAWRVLGKQFLIVAEKPASNEAATGTAAG